MADKAASREQRIEAARAQREGEPPPEKAEPPKNEKKAEGEKREGDTSKRAMDDPMRKLAHRAVEIAEAGGASLGSAITAPQAQLIKERLGASPVAKFEPATLDQLQAYAQGGRGEHRSDMPSEATEKLRTFCRESGSRRIWPRKVAAMVLALEEERTGKVRSGTKKQTAPENAKA